MKNIKTFLARLFIFLLIVIGRDVSTTYQNIYGIIISCVLYIFAFFLFNLWFISKFDLADKK